VAGDGTFGGDLDGVAVPPPPTGHSDQVMRSPALLNVPLSSVSGTYVVTLTATSSLGTASAPVTHSLTVTSAGSGVVRTPCERVGRGHVPNPSSSTIGGGVLARIPRVFLARRLHSTARQHRTGNADLLLVDYGATGNATGSMRRQSRVRLRRRDAERASRRVYTVSLFVSNGLLPDRVTPQRGPSP